MFVICDPTSKKVLQIRTTSLDDQGIRCVEVPDSHEVSFHPTWYRLNISQTGLEVDLDAVKWEKITNLSEETTKFIESHYPPQRQQTLSFLLIGAITNNPPLVQRATYIQNGLNWGFTVLSWYYQHKNTILALSTKDHVVNYTWDFSTLPPDPVASIEVALGILA